MAATKKAAGKRNATTKRNGEKRSAPDTDGLEKLGIEQSLARWVAKESFDRNDSDALLRRAARQVLIELDRQGKYNARSVNSILPKLPKRLGVLPTDLVDAGNPQMK